MICVQFRLTKAEKKQEKSAQRFRKGCIIFTNKQNSQISFTEKKASSSYWLILGFSANFCHLTQQYRISSFHLSIIGRRSFPVAASILWNSLPLDVQPSPSPPVFRRRIRTFLSHTSFPDISLQQFCFSCCIMLLWSLQQ